MPDSEDALGGSGQQQHDGHQGESRPEQGSGLSRRRFLQASAVGAAGLAVGGLGGGTAFAQTSPGGAGSTAASRGPRRPNFLFILVDEQRFPTVYESAQLADWRLGHMANQQALAATGCTLAQHHIASVACVPSRTSIFTGTYPSLHGNTATDGGAKGPIEPDMFWLEPGTVPTIGNYFRAAGYRTVYKGKWHVSHANLSIPGTESQVASYDDHGFPDPVTTQLYLGANKLGPYGFDGWIGPDPHGANPRNTGSSAATGLSGRDVVFRDQVVQQIKDFDADRGNDDPWFLVSSFTDPHDIAVYGITPWFINFLNNQSGVSANCNFSQSFEFADNQDVPDQLFNPRLFGQTYNDNLRTKPDAQLSARNAYHKYLHGIFNIPAYQRYYYTLQARVDTLIGDVMTALKQSRFYENTIVIFTSDHGDLLSSHGNMHQKWYTAYDEVTHVPMIISNPTMFRRPKVVDSLTSHIDVLPTLLGLAGLKSEPIRQQLAASFTEAVPFVGRDLTPLVTGTVSGLVDPVFYATDDDMSRGLDQFNWMGYPYASVVQPNHIQTVITTMNGSQWKLSRYFDSAQFWTSPGSVAAGCGKDNAYKPLGALKRPGVYQVMVEQVIKTTPFADQYEMYNVTDDPLEISNLYNNPRYKRQQNTLMELLQAESCAKQQQPSFGTVPGALPCY